MTENNSKFYVLFANDIVENDYLKFIEKIVSSFNKKLSIKPMTFDQINTTGILPDLILFTGGEDVSPDYYGQNQGKHTNINRERDERESRAWNLPYHIPRLGICRGMQFINVKVGGLLVQHVENHNKEHDIFFPSKNRYEDSLVLPITSSHHQMVYPFTMKKNNYDILAYSNYFKSTIYLDGDNEQMLLDPKFVETEVISYPNHNAFGIQGHPEWMDLNSNTVSHLIYLIIKYLKLNKQ